MARQTHIKTPGTTPARNSCEMEMPPPAATANKIMLWLGGMTIPAIDEIYGENTRRALQGNAGVKLYLTPADEKTVEELSKAVGKTTKKVVTRSRAIGKNPFEGRSQSVRTEEVSLLPEDEARRLPLEEIVMVIDAQMPIRAKRIEYFSDPFFKGIHGAQTGDLPFPEKEVSTRIETAGGKGRGAAGGDEPAEKASSLSEAARPKHKPAKSSPEPAQGRLPIEPVDRVVPKRESIQMAVAADQRSTIRPTKRKRAKGVVAVDADQQRQIDMDLAMQTELVLDAPTDVDVSELVGAMSELEQLRDSLPGSEDENAEVSQDASRSEQVTRRDTGHTVKA